MKTLNVKAISAMDSLPEKKYDHSVNFELEASGLIIRFKNTPGSYFWATLENFKGDKLYVDTGQGWYIENMQDVITDAKKYLKGCYK